MSVVDQARAKAVAGVALPIGPRTAAVLVLASVAGLMMLCWPLILEAQPGDRVEPPFLFLALLPLVMVVVLAEMGEGGMDSRVLAVLGVLSAINAIMRGLVSRLRSADRQIESLALLDVYGRVARALLDMSEEGADYKLIRNKVSRQDLAKVVGASREMVSRVMKDLEERGFIKTQDTGAVHIMERLAQR